MFCGEMEKSLRYHGGGGRMMSVKSGRRVRCSICRGKDR
ncbi:hypothetical protein X805_15600 [Sphaerotilus natans subsp. natans DSM 6575]|uniref:Uncharacterized protein n=1 Tax=Sphaerotilus natans subsp. natans DSM 6575 TaxID=1286631 RepID=A0A059KMY5_9BURK|nr:hypothetical protein X805_15600 [Sphaerotilus natans subsp. natans DSM 6575]